MSLIHWWPLNGNLNDKGTGTCTLSGSPTYGVGKLGQCLTSGTLTMPAAATTQVFNKNAVSIAFWINNISGDYKCLFGTEGMTAPNNRRFTLFRYPSHNDLHWSWQNYDSGSTFTSGVAYGALTDGWNHICAVWNNGTATIYVNGSSIAASTGTCNTTDWALDTVIARADSTCYYNDIRLYNHALSAKEVKEISKGLVLHYNFEDEYIEPTTNLVTQLVSGGRTSITNNAVVTNGENGDTYFYLKFPAALVQGTTYTISCDAEIPTGGTGTQWKFGMGSQSASDPNFIINNGHNEYTFVCTANSAKQQLLFDDMSRIYGVSSRFYNFQVEQKDHATPYVNGTRSAGKVYDNSGYGYNSTAAENLQIIANSSSGQHSVALNGSSTKITTPFTCQNFGNDFTVSAWLKSNVNSGGYLTAVGNETSTSGIVFAELTSTNRLQCYISASNGSDINICSYTSFAANTWYHVVYTVKNALSSPEAKLYINGALVSTVTGTSAFNETTEPLYIGCNKSYRFWNGLMSDFKIYATALSADDVLLEYNRKAAIDKNGNLFTGELVESNANADIDKNNFVKATTFVEGKDKTKIFGGYTELNGLQFNGAQYIQTNIKTMTAPFEVEVVYDKTNTTTSDQCLFGERNFGKFTNIYATYYESAYGNTASGTVPGNTGKHTVTMKSDSGLYEDGVLLKSGTLGNRTGTYGALIGAFTESTSFAAKWFFNGLIYSLKIYENGGQLTHNFVPVKNKSNVLGMFDMVDQKFYTNAGSGSFTAGPEIGTLSLIAANKVEEL